MSEILSLLALGLRLVLLIMEQVKESKAEAGGYQKAMKEVLEQAHFDLAAADAEREQAAEQHKQHDDDSAFDPEFRRP